jgi:predicted nuclease of predicted toxin-antitoxin system
VNFLVDAHLPPALCALLRENGHDARHTRDLPQGNRTRDTQINELSIREQRVVITKDSDFFHTHLLLGRPHRLLLVCTGNLGVRDMLNLFRRQLPTILAALERNTLVELHRAEVRAIH